MNAVVYVEEIVPVMVIQKCLMCLLLAQGRADGCQKSWTYMQVCQHSLGTAFRILRMTTSADLGKQVVEMRIVAEFCPLRQNTNRRTRSVLHTGTTG
jgi:hypothetical protein